ncbi:MAG: MotA/TolQ/ExbB proton channel family protein [Myxococcota bacterium]
MNMATPTQVVEFVAMGGAVMLALIALGMVLGTAFVLRWFELQSGLTQDVRVLVERQPGATQAGLLPRIAAQAHRLVNDAEPAWRLRQLFRLERDALRRREGGLDNMIVTAPLLGLLGTVTGMIDTFHALGLHTASSEALADGISKALITTEFGLFIAIPAILVSRALRRRQVRVDRALHEMEARFASRIHDEVP